MSFTAQSGLVNVTSQATLKEGDSGRTEKVVKTDAPAVGTSSGQFDLVYKHTRTVTNSSTPDDFDLTSLVWNGNDVASAAAKVVEVMIKHTNTAQKLTFGGGTNAFLGWLAGTTPTEQIGKSNGTKGTVCFHENYVDGWTVDGTHKNFRVATDSATAHSYEIIIKARSV